MGPITDKSFFLPQDGLIDCWILFYIDGIVSKWHIRFNGVFKTRQGVMVDWRSFLPEAGEKISPLPRFLTGSYFHPLDAQHPSLSLPLQRSTTQKITTTVHFGSRHHHRDRSMDLLEECVVVLASAVGRHPLRAYELPNWSQMPVLAPKYIGPDNTHFFQAFSSCSLAIGVAEP